MALKMVRKELSATQNTIKWCGPSHYLFIPTLWTAVMASHTLRVDVTTTQIYYSIYVGPTTCPYLTCISSGEHHPTTMPLCTT